MILIAGLGNPGKLYINSRHNIGFKVIEALSKKYRTSLNKDKDTLSLIGKVNIEDKDVLLAMPQTFMNLSGVALKQLQNKYAVGLSDILVICDDLDLEFGRLKLRPQGSSGVHRGLESIMNSLGSQKLARLRIGIGRPDCDIDAASYVLAGFKSEEKEELKQIINQSCLCCQAWLSKGITEAMNIFNARRKNE